MPTAAKYRSYLQLPQVRAALDTIGWAEGGRSYNTLSGGGTFAGNQHPNRPITTGGYTSTAAGRYQFLYRTWIEIKDRLRLPDFSPVNRTSRPLT
jgi:muramidase (phage lysozyme)